MSPRLLFTLLALLAPLGCTAATQGGPVCGDACATGTLCVAGRCRPEGSSPSPSNTRRLLLEPAELAVIASRSAAREQPPATIALGRAADGTVELLLRFEADFPKGTQIVSAFILLEPLAGALPTTPTSFEMARILDPWDAATVTWGRQPRLSLAALAALNHPTHDGPVRVDVTQLVREWSEGRPDDHGIALLVEGKDPIGTAYSTGMSQGHGPRLEVYLR